MSIIIWSIYYINIYFLQKAFQFDLSWSQILVLLVITTIALSIPSAPGMIGTFHAAAQYTIVEMFEYPASIGNSFAIVLHAYGYILFTLLGAYYFFKSQFYDNALENILHIKVNNHS